MRLVEQPCIIEEDGGALRLVACFLDPTHK
jgi:hypothetical protein